MNAPLTGGDARGRFCDTVGGRTPAHHLYEDARTIAFLKIHPVTEGHPWGSPKRHNEPLTDFGAVDQDGVFATFSRRCRQTQRLTSDHHIALTAGSSTGQPVFHLHSHLVPRPREPDPCPPTAWPRFTDDEARGGVLELREG